MLIVFKIVRSFFIYYFDSIEAKIGEKLVKNNIKLSVAESCTGGLISSRLTDISGSSDYISINFVTYANDAKEKYLNVNNKTLIDDGAVSQKCAIEMARGIIGKNDEIDLALSITGILGPNGDSKTKHVGLVYICILNREKYIVKEFNMFLKNPYQYKNKFINNLLRKCLKIDFSQRALKLLYDFLLINYTK